MTNTPITAKLNKLKAELNTAGGKIVGGTFLAASLLSLSQEANGANNDIDKSVTQQKITEQSLDGKDSSQLLREKSNNMNKKMWSHKIDLGDGYSIMESSVTLSGEDGYVRENLRTLIQPDGKAVSLNFLEMNKFITPSKQEISSAGNIEEKFDNGLTRSQAEKENLKTLALMKKQLDERLDESSTNHVFAYVKSCLNKQMNQLGDEKASFVSNKMFVQRANSRS